jgi:integrase
VTPHDMRRFVVTRLLEGGHDLLLVSRLVGHSDPAVTKLYDRRPAEACRAAVRTLPLPMPRAGGASGVCG